MKDKIALLWAQKIVNGERKLSEAPRGLLSEIKKAITELMKD